jgi:hypothetical protein
MLLVDSVEGMMMHGIANQKLVRTSRFGRIITTQGGQCACNDTLRRYRGKEISITYSECVSVAQLFSMQSPCALLYCHM